MTPTQMEEGYWSSYRNFYSWRNIVRGAQSKSTFTAAARHVAYSAGWKKFEPYGIRLSAQNEPLKCGRFSNPS